VLAVSLTAHGHADNPNNYSSIPYYSRWSGIPGGDAKTNRRQNSYYVPEIDMVFKRYQELNVDPTALARFIEEQQTLASQMMEVTYFRENFWTALIIC
jgi:hypothetical protein